MLERKYKSKIDKRKDISLFHFDNIDKEYDYENQIEIKINWQMDIWEREWGIDTMSITVNSIDMEMVYNAETPEKDEEREFKKTFDLEKWKVRTEMSDLDTITPHEITIDFDEETIDIKF